MTEHPCTSNNTIISKEAPTEERESLLGEKASSSSSSETVRVVGDVVGRSESEERVAIVALTSESVSNQIQEFVADSSMMHSGHSSNGGAFQRKNASVVNNSSLVMGQEVLLGSDNGNGTDARVNSMSDPFAEKRDNLLQQRNSIIGIGTVKRSKCGTSPFDEHWLNTDCCGLFCALFTYSLHMYSCFAVTFKLLKPWFYDHEHGRWGIIGIIHNVLFVTIAFLACMNHFLAMITDPGAVPPDAAPLHDPETGLDETTAFKINPAKLGRRFCRRCNAYKPQRAHHCSICKRCVVKMDHHCPWVNNCVGIGNHKFFLLFIFYTFGSCLYSFTLLFWRGWNCGVIPNRNDPCMENPGDLVFLVGLAIEALLFGLFTSCMIIDQIETVTTNLTQIDRLKGESLNNTLPDVNEVFGGNGLQSGFRLDWLAPIAVKFPASIRDEIYGFCRPCTKVIGSKVNEEVEMSTITKNAENDEIFIDIV